MRIDVITLFPQMLEAITKYGVSGRAVSNGQLEVIAWNPRDFTQDRHRTVDDRPYGGGAGMVMMAEPLRAAIEAAQNAQPATPARVVALTPQGRPLSQSLAGQLQAAGQRLILVTGRYEGIDQRLLDQYIDMEISIGDYVLSGGEVAAMVVIDTLTRLIPGVLGHADSAQMDSFADGLLEYPQYTRPEIFAGQAVPEVLLSGDHDAIARWRAKQALGRTWQLRPDLLDNIDLDNEQRDLLAEYQRESHQS